MSIFHNIFEKYKENFIKEKERILLFLYGSFGKCIVLLVSIVLI